MLAKNNLIVSESFYSVQGEGKYLGHPAVFLRLAGCNLRCNGFSYQSPAGEHLGCDTKHVWRSGKKHTFAAIIAFWEQHDWITKLKQGAHLIITGGEPLLHQLTLMQFIHHLDSYLHYSVFIEIETNATIMFTTPLLTRINQINASPKLSNSYEPENKSYQPAVIEQLSQLNKVIFKFVIQKQNDINEVITKFQQRFNIPRAAIWLMPEGGKVEVLQERSLWLVELCKQHLLNFSPRLHINIWGEVTGV